ncbi:MAG: hypothetical protein ISS16_06385 [Ignavibacteria bacterium]|nr:hypothetical protein [Ignavibacteria bacterium]
MKEKSLPNIALLKEKYRDKIKDITCDLNNDKIIFYKIYLLGKFENPLIVYINEFETDGATKYISTISHFFKSPVSKQPYCFNFEDHDCIENAFKEIYERGLDNYSPDDLEAEWEVNPGFKESPI